MISSAVEETASAMADAAVEETASAMADAAAQPPKMPAGGGFGVWRGANFDMIRDEAAKMPEGIGRGGIARKASEFWSAMSDAEKAPFTATFQEQLAAFRNYQQSDSYVKPEKKKKKVKSFWKGSKKGKSGASKRLVDEAHDMFLDAVAKFQEFYNEKTLEPDEEEAHAIFSDAVVAFKEFSEKNKSEPEEEEGLDAHELAEKIQQLVEANPQKKRKVEASELSDEEARPQKKPKVKASELSDEDAAIVAEAKKEGLQKKLESMMENPKIASKGFQTLLDALRAAGGKVPEAKRALLGK